MLAQCNRLNQERGSDGGSLGSGAVNEMKIKISLDSFREKLAVRWAHKSSDHFLITVSVFYV